MHSLLDNNILCDPRRNAAGIVHWVFGQE